MSETTPPTPQNKHRTWSRPKYLISTNPSLIPLSTLNAAFASPDIYWALPLPEPAMKEMLQNSLSFGLYDLSSPLPTSPEQEQELEQQPKPNLIGFSRLITDTTTFAYLTDVYIWPGYQGQGLGKWLISCVREVLEAMPYLRRSVLFTGNWERSVPFYERELGMEVVGQKAGKGGPAVMQWKGKGFPGGLYIEEKERESGRVGEKRV